MGGIPLRDIPVGDIPVRDSPQANEGHQSKGPMREINKYYLATCLVAWINDGESWEKRESCRIV